MVPNWTAAEDNLPDTKCHQHCDNATNCLTEMLPKWLTSIFPPPTWRGLIQALLSAPVEEKRLAEEIMERYCHQGGEQATGPAPGEV